MTDTAIIKTAGKMLKSGASAKEVSITLKVPARTVYTWRQRLGINENKAALIWAEPGLSNVELAKKLGISRTYVWQVRNGRR